MEEATFAMSVSAELEQLHQEKADAEPEEVVDVSELEVVSADTQKCFRKLFSAILSRTRQPDRGQNLVCMPYLVWAHVHKDSMNS